MQLWGSLQALCVLNEDFAIFDYWNILALEKYSRFVY